LSRDDFTKPVIDKLKGRVASRCSNPTCRVPTSGPTDAGGVNNTGVAAHITAASEGGPRFEESLSREKRKSIENGIWLCSSCAKMIDGDTAKYTVNLINNWKRKAEAEAEQEQGKKLPSKSDAIDTLTTALTGASKTYIQEMIPNVHKATKESLERIDPNYNIETSYINGQTSFKIIPKGTEPPEVKFSFQVPKSEQHQLSNLLEHGRDVELNIESARVVGSKLFEEVFNVQEGAVKISPEKKSSIVKLSLLNTVTGEKEQYDDVNGYLVFGTKSFSFFGKACNYMLDFNLQCPVDDNRIGDAKLSISCSLEQWKDLDILTLPYFDKLLSLFSKLDSEWNLFADLEVNGGVLVSSKGASLDKDELISNFSIFLRYVKYCRVIAKILHLSIKFSPDETFNYSEFQNIAEVAGSLHGKQVYDAADIKDTLAIDLTIADDLKNLKLITNVREPTTLKYCTVEAEAIIMFGVEVNLPVKEITLHNVLPVIEQDLNTLKAGDIVAVKWLPQDNFKCSIQYIGPSL